MYAIRRSSFDYAWKVAIAVGIIANVVLVVSGELVFDVHIPYGGMIGGNIVAGLIAVVLEFLYLQWTIPGRNRFSLKMMSIITTSRQFRRFQCRLQERQ